MRTEGGFLVKVAIQQGLAHEPVQYAVRSLLCALGVQFETELYEPDQPMTAPALLISYGFDPPCAGNIPHLHIAASRFFTRGEYLRESSLPNEPVRYEDLVLPFDGESRPSGSGRGVPSLRVPDVLAGAFFLLTRYEEFVSGGPLDERGRFSASASWLSRNLLLRRPLVNEYLEALRRWIVELVPRFSPAEPNWHGRPFAIALTRDIDSLHKYEKLPARAVVRDALRGRLGKVARQAGRLVLNGDPYNNLGAIIEWERQLGIRSSIYLMSSSGAGDSNYQLREISECGELNKAASEGWELGFHPGRRTSNNEEVFLKELSQLRQVAGEVAGGRQHTLAFRVPYTWRAWEKGGLTYDSTLGYADQEGFRCGYCLPFRPFDLIENRELELWELPLTVMDCTFDRYRRVSPEQARSSLRELLATVRRHNGVLVLLWHNTYFGRNNRGFYHDVFADFVESALEAGGYVGPALEVVSEWARQSVFARSNDLETNALVRAGGA